MQIQKQTMYVLRVQAWRRPSPCLHTQLKDKFVVECCVFLFATGKRTCIIAIYEYNIITKLLSRRMLYEYQAQRRNPAELQ